MAQTAQPPARFLSPPTIRFQGSERPSIYWIREEQPRTAETTREIVRALPISVSISPFLTRRTRWKVWPQARRTDARTASTIPTLTSRTVSSWLEHLVTTLIMQKSSSCFQQDRGPTEREPSFRSTKRMIRTTIWVVMPVATMISTTTMTNHPPRTQGIESHEFEVLQTNPSLERVWRPSHTTKPLSKTLPFPSPLSASKLISLANTMIRTAILTESSRTRTTISRFPFKPPFASYRSAMPYPFIRPSSDRKNFSRGREKSSTVMTKMHLPSLMWTTQRHQSSDLTYSKSQTSLPDPSSRIAGSFRQGLTMHPGILSSLQILCEAR